MKIDKIDPVNKIIKSDIKDITTYLKLVTWKLSIIKVNTDVIFVKNPDSKYILAVTSISKVCRLLGIWNTSDSVGVTSDQEINSLHTLLLISVPPEKLNIYNTDIFKSSDSNDLEEKAFELLCRMLNSTNHYNKSHKELAIKSLQLAIEFKTNYNDLTALISSFEN